MPFTPVFPLLTSFVVKQGLGTSWDPLWHQIESVVLTIQQHRAWHWSEPRPDPFHWQEQEEEAGSRILSWLRSNACVHAGMETCIHSQKTGLNRASSVAHKHLNWPCCIPGNLINMPVNTKILEKTVKWKKPPESPQAKGRLKPL